jgi:cytochrome c oxidase cbb3-type subunit 2
VTGITAFTDVDITTFELQSSPGFQPFNWCCGFFLKEQWHNLYQATEADHSVIEKNIGLMVVLVPIMISFGGLVQIVPLFFQEETTTPVEGLKPWTALQLEGRDIYIREGCNTCHSQMIRPLRGEVERYGHYSVAGEHVYEFPFLWGSKRTGPDLARVGERYSNEWHRAHLYNPRDVVPESIMPSYPWLFEDTVDGRITPKKMKALHIVGVPYTDADIEGAKAAVDGMREIEALVAYLQQLGTVMKDKQ